MGIRRRKHRPAARPLDASWIESDDAELLQSSSTSTMDDRSTLSQKETKAKQDTTEPPEAKQLEVPDVSQDDTAHSRSPAPSHSSGGFGPPASISANDDASFNSQQGAETTRSRDSRPARLRKRRYASKHDSHWLEQDAHLPTDQPQAESSRLRPQADLSQDGASAQQQPHQQWGPATGHVNVVQTPSTKSPSIFRPAAYDTNQGYDAPPITPKVRPNYSPFAE